MAMGDNVRTRNLMNQQNARGQQLFENAQSAVGAQGQQFQGDYGRALESDSQMRNAAMGGYQNMINTGGFTPTGIAAMRARAMSPIRAAYSNAQRDIGRQQAMGGTSAGRGTLMARMAREQGQAGSDAGVNTEAALAQMIQQGRMAGLGGMTSLYGTAPGNTGMQSRNVLENMNQGLGLVQNENQRMGGILGIQNAQNAAPGKGGTALNMAGQMAQIYGNTIAPGAAEIFKQVPKVGAKPAPINM